MKQTKTILIIIGISVLLYALYWFFCGPYQNKKIQCAHDYAYTKTSYNPISGCWYWNEHISKMTNVFDCSYRDSFDHVSQNEIKEQIDMFYKAADIYENDVKKAYGLADAYTFLNETFLNRIGDVITSRVLGLFPGRVDDGRGGLRGAGYMFGWMCSKQFQNAYHAITGAQAHFPKDKDSPMEVLRMIKETKYTLETIHGWNPGGKK